MTSRCTPINPNFVSITQHAIVTYESHIGNLRSWVQKTKEASASWMALDLNTQTVSFSDLSSWQSEAAEHYLDFREWRDTAQKLDQFFVNAIEKCRQMALRVSTIDNLKSSGIQANTNTYHVIHLLEEQCMDK